MAASIRPWNDWDDMISVGNGFKQETIFALSSGAGQAGVAVIRVSGPSADEAVRRLSGKDALPAPRRATVLPLFDPTDGELIDHALVLWFPGPASFTGEDLAEFHVHGSRSVVQALFHVLGSMPGFRIAHSGEFTRRAFEHGKLDLAQAEAIADLIAADTFQQRKFALRGLGGALGRLVAQWRDVVLEAKALVAAEIDFSDEGDVGDNASAGVDSLLQRLRREISLVSSSKDMGRILQDGYRVAIVGKPNSGKSSLLNALAGSDVAIVTEFAGTTRDVIQVKLDIGGFPFVLQDTAGFRESVDPVEKIGIERSVEAASTADLVIHLSADNDWDPLHHSFVGLNTIRVRSKSDLQSTSDAGSAACSISVKTGNGLQELLKMLVAEIEPLPDVSQVVVNMRQLIALSAAQKAVEAALRVPPGHVELIDHELEAVRTSLDLLVGRIGTEDVLGAIFSRFCVGK